MECEAQTKTQLRKRRGPSKESTEKEADSRRPELGNHGRKSARKDALPNSRQAGAAKWAQYRAAGNPGYRGQKKTPRQDRGALFYENYCITLIRIVKSIFALF